MNVYQKPRIPKTINTFYNEAWAVLAKYCSESIGISGVGENLCLDTAFPRSKHQFLEFTRALLEVEAIGTRNGWLSHHVNGRGQVTFLVNRIKQCPTCDGTGELPDGQLKLEKMREQSIEEDAKIGVAPNDHDAYKANLEYLKSKHKDKPCPDCDGTGYGDPRYSTPRNFKCPTCKGTGKEV